MVIINNHVRRRIICNKRRLVSSIPSSLSFHSFIRYHQTPRLIPCLFFFPYLLPDSSFLHRELVGPTPHPPIFFLCYSYVYVMQLYIGPIVNAQRSLKLKSQSSRVDNKLLSDGQNRPAKAGA